METITDHGWTWANVYADLTTQGALDKDDLVIDPTMFCDAHYGGGFYRGDIFTMTWVKDTFLLLSMTRFSQTLIDAFAAVVEYQPFVCYTSSAYTTVEWDKADPDGRWERLQGEACLRRITK